MSDEELTELCDDRDSPERELSEEEAGEKEWGHGGYEVLERFESHAKGQVHFPRIREFICSDAVKRSPLYTRPEGCGLQCGGPKQPVDWNPESGWRQIGRAILAVQKVQRSKLFGCCNMYGDDGMCHRVLNNEGFPARHCDALIPASVYEVDLKELEDRVTAAFEGNEFNVVDFGGVTLSFDEYIEEVKKGRVDAVKGEPPVYVRFKDSVLGRMARMVFLDNFSS